MQYIHPQRGRACARSRRCAPARATVRRPRRRRSGRIDKHRTSRGSGSLHSSHPKKCMDARTALRRLALSDCTNPWNRPHKPPCTPSHRHLYREGRTYRSSACAGRVVCAWHLRRRLRRTTTPNREVGLGCCCCRHWATAPATVISGDARATAASKPRSATPLLLRESCGTHESILEHEP